MVTPGTDSGHPAPKNGISPDIPRLITDLGDAPHDHVIDEDRIEAVALSKRTSAFQPRGRRGANRREHRCVVQGACALHRRSRPHARVLLGMEWRRSDSNRRPPGCKPGALPTELRPQRMPEVYRASAASFRHRPGDSESRLEHHDDDDDRDEQRLDVTDATKRLGLHHRFG